jgi:hypothetical protein
MALSLAVNANKMGDGAIIRALCLGRKETAWQFPHPPVVANAITAFTLSRARLVGARAFCSILVDVTLHIFPSDEKVTDRV